MSYKIDIRCEPDYLYVQASGIRSAENAISLIKDYMKANENHGYKRIMVDIRSMTGELSTIDSFIFGDGAPKKLGGVHSELKTAIVDLEEHRERFRFSEGVLVNRGFNLRFFSRTAHAERWLRKSK